MADENGVPEELRGSVDAGRFQQFTELGVGGVENELKGRPGPLGLSSSHSDVQKMAWQWVEWKKAQASSTMSAKAALPAVVPTDALERIWGEDGFRVFLSHRSDVKKEVGDLKDELELFGARCFVAHQDIHATQDWQNELLHGLASMHCLVAVLTDKFHESEWTDQEVGYALARDVPIIALKLGSDNPRGFISRFQARSCTWNTAAAEIVKIAINYAGMLDAYVAKLRTCPSWDHGNFLGKALPGIKKLSSAQIDALVAAFNEHGELSGSFAFNGSKPRDYGPGLVHHLNRLGTRKFIRDDSRNIVESAV